LWLLVVFTQSVSALHELPQLVPLQKYGEQLDVVAAEHVPAPLQNAVGVNVVPLQDEAAQVTLVEACWQEPAPLHAPVLPQVPLAGQPMCGSATLLGTLLQTPALPLMLQALQVGQLALPQQTPSTQKPLVHSWPVKQATPFDLNGRQLPAGPVQ